MRNITTHKTISKFEEVNDMDYELIEAGISELDGFLTFEEEEEADEAASLIVDSFWRE